MLRWDWNHKIGILTYRNYQNEEVGISIYKGNALMIFIKEFPDDTFQLFSFFADKQHLKNLLNEDNFFKDWVSIELWEINNDIFQAVKSLYKKGIEIHLNNMPF